MTKGFKNAWGDEVSFGKMCSPRPAKKVKKDTNKKTRYGREISNGTHKAMVYSSEPCVHLVNLSTKVSMDVYFDNKEEREKFLDVIFNRD